MTESDNGKKGAPHRGRKFRPKRLKTALPRPEKETAPSAAKSAERIAKVMARAGVASRREAEAMIAAGRVAVNGKTIVSPALNVTSQDRIVVDGKPLPQRERTRLFLFHKPRGLVTTSADTHGRPTIFGALPDGMPRLISVGRLDLNTEGLLLLTNDGGLARALELPATGWLRRYRVRAFGQVTQQRLDELKNGIAVDGISYGAIEATLDRVQGSNVWITFAMREGKNREIRNVLRALGLQVNRLIRLSFGPFQLGDLEEGAIEEVKTRALRDQIGPRLATQAGADFSGPLVEREEPHAPRKPHGPPSHRHPEVRAQRASKGDGPERRSKPAAKGGGRPSFPPPFARELRRAEGAPKRESAKAGEGRLRQPPQDDGAKSGGRRDKRNKGRPYRGQRDR